MIVVTSMNVLLTATYAKTVTVSTPKDLTNANVTKVSKSVLMANSASVNLVFLFGFSFFSFFNSLINRSSDWILLPSINEWYVHNTYQRTDASDEG